ncbi:MAG: anti-sigma factor [Desulfatiglans sp.]|jgi:anti-sigma factor RsiW|nr:anti-sigma factor [Thermodesulfobacteriota bacterium]MEE4352188.1 anti-sigma factor [Desulfatiglans sp.]
MKRSKACDSMLLSRHMDGELSPAEYDWLMSHLAACPDCQEELRQNEALRTLYKSDLAEERSQVSFQGLERKVLKQVSQKRLSWWMRHKELFFSKKLLIPATAMAAMVLLFFSLIRQPLLPPDPSAIITSLSGDMTSVIVLETPKTRQTIIWFNEAS